MVGTTAFKLAGVTIPPVSNQRQTNSNCTVRQTRSLSLPTPALQQAIFTRFLVLGAVFTEIRKIS